MQPPAPLTFQITPSIPGGASGVITEVGSSDAVHFHVIVTGLVAGSGHAIHEHAGTCAAANRSVHLTVLTTAMADSHGVIVFDTSLPAFYFGPSRIVIVYDGARPVLIAGCATL
jgi:hypothetical protein